MLEAILMVLVMGVLMLLSFLIGAKTAQKADRGEDIKLPNINHVKAYEAYQERKAIEQEEKERNIMLENIDNYDGTGLGQKNIN